MNPSSLVRPILLAVFFLANGSTQAGESFAVSGDVLVDTRLGGDFKPTMSFRRVTQKVIRPMWRPGNVDEPIRVEGSDPAALLAEPLLSRHPRNYPGIGMIADGVTPLLVVVSAPANMTTDRNYRIITDHFGVPYYGSAFSGHIRLLTPDSSGPATRITLGPSKPHAFLLVEPIHPDSFGYHSSADGYQPLVIQLGLLEEQSNRIVTDEYFEVRRPPVVLVHGYNSNGWVWSAEFLEKLRIRRGEDFVIRAHYGTANDNDRNTRGDFKTLLTDLSEELLAKMEGSNPAWPAQHYAWTRYDAVGHSQGGVLLRWLCSSSAAEGSSLQDAGFGFPAFRSEANHRRGRFRRVVTIGSPHVGSTIAHLAIRMDEEDVSLRWEDAPSKFKPALEYIRAKKEKILQEKFMIDLPDAGSGRTPTARSLNEQLVEDRTARIHFHASTIYGGRAPDNQPGLNFELPAIYYFLRLNTKKTYHGSTWGEWVAPSGTDGVVDVRSQLALAKDQPARSNTSTEWLSIETSHSRHEIMFGTDVTQTKSVSVGMSVAWLIDQDDSKFGSSPSFWTLDNEMSYTADAIEHIVATLKARQQKSIGSMIRRILPGGKPMAQRDEVPGDKPHPPILHDTPSPEFSLELEEGEPIAGNAIWTAWVYGPDGISSEGLTLTVSGTNGELAGLSIDEAVVGRITLQVSYPSSTGKTIIGVEEVVETRDPGLLTGLELRPGSIELPVGCAVPLQVWGVFSAGGPCLMFADGMRFEISNPDVATVSARGVVSLIAPGAASVTVDDGGSHTATLAVTVLPAAPVITSPEVASVVAGQPFSYQIMAENSPTHHGAEALPYGLALNPSTGLLSGTLEEPGALLIRLGASNANGTGRLDLRLLVDPGNNQPPGNIALDPFAVPAKFPAGTEVGTLSAYDPNPADEEFTYALVVGEGADDNGLFAISGSLLLTTAEIDPASKPLCRIRLRCTDPAGLFMEKSFELPVLGAPVIVSHPQNAEGMAWSGVSLVLAVDAQGYGPLTYSWELDGQPVDWAREPVLDLFSDPSLTGEWTVTVSNPHGSTTSDVAIVKLWNLSYSGWIYRNGWLLGDQAGPMDDPGEIGVPNLMRFAFTGYTPVYEYFEGNLDVLPKVVMEEGRPVLRYMRGMDTELTAFRLMLSQDLEEWTEYLPTPDDVTREPADLPFWDTEIIHVKLPDLPNVFFRIEVEE